MKIRSLLYLSVCLIPALAHASLEIDQSVEPVEETVAQSENTASETLSKLDLDGYFLAYLDIEGITHPLREELLALAGKIDAVAEEGSQEKLAVQTATDTVDPLLEWLGLYSVRSFGASLTSMGDCTTRSKGFVRFNEQVDTAAFKRLFGAPSSLPSCYFAPADASAFSTSTFSFSGLWDVIREGITSFGDAPTKQQFVGSIAMLKEQMGIDLDALFATIDDEYMIGVRLDEANKVTFPMPNGEVFEIPAPAAIMGFKVTDTSLYDTLIALLPMTGMPAAELSIAGESAITIQLPIPSPIEVSPTLMMYDGYLLIASTPAIMEDTVMSYVNGDGLVQTEDFQANLADVPEEITTITYLDKSLYRTVADITAKAVRMEQAIDGEDELLALMRNELISVIESRADMDVAGYEIWNDEGYYTETYTRSSTDNVIYESIRQPMYALILTTIQGMRAKKQQEEMMLECMENLSVISQAKLQWAEDNNYPDEAPTPEDLEPYIEGDFPICPMGGNYEINTPDVPASCNIHSFE